MRELDRVYHKARQSHWCDYCPCPIEVGDVYERMVWVYNNGSLVVSKCHHSPTCPEDPFDDVFLIAPPPQFHAKAA